MDNFKKPQKGTKVNVRVEKKNEVLTDLYRKSEYAKDNPSISDPADNNNDDINSFINEQEHPEQTDIPEKASAQKARKKAAKKEKRKTSIKKAILKLFILLFVISGITIAVLVLFKPDITQNIIGEGKGSDTKSDIIYYSPLTGLESSDSNAETAATTCVMIENSTDARPQSGLRDAGVVYEAIAEGGITRFMAVYQDSRPNYLGPIRSARLTFVHFARQYQCGYVHMGGAYNAINELKNSGYRDINAGFYEEKYVSRKISKGRSAPHNVYSRFAWLDELSFDKGWANSIFIPFARIAPDTTVETENLDATNITIKMSSASYNPVYSYDKTSNTYRRSHQSGGEHMDRAEDGTLTQIAPNVVIAMKVHAIPRASDHIHNDYETSGEGDCFVFQNGTVISGKWRRANIDSPLKFYDANGEEILLNRGQTWITAYPDNNSSAVNWN